MDQLTAERLMDNLQRLKLSRAAEMLDAISQEAETNKSSYLVFLDHLLEEEVAAKEKRRIQTAMKPPGCPAPRPLKSMNSPFIPIWTRKW